MKCLNPHNQNRQKSRQKDHQKRGSSSLKTRGFTLLEVLLAVSLLGLISLSIFQSMSLSIRAKKSVVALNERYHEGRQVMRRITRELRMAFLRAQPPEETTEEEPAVITRMEGEEDEIKSVGYSGLVGVLIEAVKELSETVTELRAEVNELKGNT